MKKILILIIPLLLITGCNKESKYVSCEASEKVNDTTTKIITKYNYNKNGLLINSIDYTIEVTNEKNAEELTISKSFFENTICNKANQPENVSCKITLTETELSVVTHEDIKNNQSTVLGIAEINKITYDSFKNNKKEGVTCTFK